MVPATSDPGPPQPWPQHPWLSKQCDRSPHSLSATATAGTALGSWGERDVHTHLVLVLRVLHLAQQTWGWGWRWDPFPVGSSCVQAPHTGLGSICSCGDQPIPFPPHRLPSLLGPGSSWQLQTANPGALGYGSQPHSLIHLSIPGCQLTALGHAKLWGTSDIQLPLPPPCQPASLCSLVPGQRGSS